MSQENFSVLIIEDELPARELLIEFLLHRPELKLDGIAKNGDEALQKLSEKEYDIIFLDISLPVMSGIELLERLDFKPNVIFTTAFDKYALRAFDLGAIDYLLKPFTFKRFNQAVDKVILSINTLKNNKNESDSPEIMGLSFKEDNKHHIIGYDDIVYLTSKARHTIVHTDDQVFEASKLLKDLVDKLPADRFLRIHKQHCINLKYAFRLESIPGGLYELMLKDNKNTMLPVGKKYAPELKERLRI